MIRHTDIKLYVYEHFKKLRAIFLLETNLFNSGSDDFIHVHANYRDGATVEHVH